jgi:hypothetical protein
MLLQIQEYVCHVGIAVLSIRRDGIAVEYQQDCTALPLQSRTFDDPGQYVPEGRKGNATDTPLRTTYAPIPSAPLVKFGDVKSSYIGY